MDELIVAEVYPDMRNTPTVNAEKNEISFPQLTGMLHLARIFKLFFCGARKRTDAKDRCIEDLYKS